MFRSTIGEYKRTQVDEQIKEKENELGMTVHVTEYTRNLIDIAIFKNMNLVLAGSLNIKEVRCGTEYSEKDLSDNTEDLQMFFLELLEEAMKKEEWKDE
jgi:hypothetical protein